MKVLIIVDVADTECVTSNAYFSSDSAYRLHRCHSHTGWPQKWLWHNFLVRLNLINTSLLVNLVKMCSYRSRLVFNCCFEDT